MSDPFFFFFELAFIVLSVSYQTYIERRDTSTERYSSTIWSKKDVGKKGLRQRCKVKVHF